MSILSPRFRFCDEDPTEPADDVDPDVRAQAREERVRRANMRHWCEDCHGRPGGPCDIEEQAG